MRIPWLYLQLPLSVDATVPLDDNAFAHVVRVLQLKSDAPIDFNQTETIEINSLTSPDFLVD